MSLFTGQRSSVLLTVGQLSAENGACNTCVEPNAERRSTAHRCVPLRGPPKEIILANFHYKWYPYACDWHFCSVTDRFSRSGRRLRNLTCSPILAAHYTILLLLR